MHALSALASELRLERERQRITLRELAERIGVSFSYLSKLERGQFEPSRDVLERWALSLGRRIEVALVHDDTPVTPAFTPAQQAALRSILDAMPELTDDQAAHVQALADILLAAGRSRSD